jgi:hypothetical protein
MYLYLDIFNEKELVSDAYPCTIVDGMFLEVEGKNMKIDNSISDAVFGGNASAEEACEESADTVETKIDIVHTFKLEKYEMAKKDYKPLIMKYAKKLSDKKKAEGASPDELKAFQGKLLGKVKDILEKYDQYDVYINDEYDLEGWLPILNYREDGVTPYFTYFLDGLRKEKC